MCNYKPTNGTKDLVERTENPSTVEVVLTFVEPHEIDTTYGAELADAADRMLATGEMLEPISSVLAGRSPVDLLNTFRVIGAGLLSRCYADGQQTAGDTALRLSKYINWLYGVGQDSEAAAAVNLAAALIASDFLPTDTETTDAANAMPPTRLMVGVTSLVLGTAIVVTNTLAENSPGGDSIRWILDRRTDPEPGATVSLPDLSPPGS